MRYYVCAPTTERPNLGSALTPPMVRAFNAWSSRGEIYGQPGTQAVPIVVRESLSFGLNDLANVGISFSACAPDVIFPPLYYVTGNQEHCPVSIKSDNQMPVPAVRARNYYIANPFKARMGGQRQIRQPQVIQRWLGMNDSA